MADLLYLMAELCVILVAEFNYNLVLQVRVRRMVLKDSIEEMFPIWPGEDDDPQLVRLITDIHSGRFVKGLWEVQGNAKGKGNEKKRMKLKLSHPLRSRRKLRHIMSLKLMQRERVLARRKVANIWSWRTKRL